MIICLAKKEDIISIAMIHKTEISGGFLSSLGSAFLEKFYLALIESPTSFCVVAKENDRIIGFISGVSDMNAFYTYFLGHYFFQSFFILLPKIFISLKKILESLWYPKKEPLLPKAELLTVAVKKEFQGKGVASQILAEFISEMKKRDISDFKVLVGGHLKPAIKFYEKSGFTFIKNTSVHGTVVSKIYVYTL